MYCGLRARSAAARLIAARGVAATLGREPLVHRAHRPPHQHAEGGPVPCGRRRLRRPEHCLPLESAMATVAYTSNVRIERVKGPLRIAYLPGEPRPVTFSVHGAIAEHYKVDPATLTESHAATIDYVVAATAG